MMINVDAFFISALNEAGFSLSFNQLKEIYKKSRQDPGYVARRARIEAENLYIQKMEMMTEEERKEHWKNVHEAASLKAAQAEQAKAAALGIDVITLRRREAAERGRETKAKKAAMRMKAREKRKRAAERKAAKAASQPEG